MRTTCTAIPFTATLLAASLALAEPPAAPKLNQGYIKVDGVETDGMKVIKQYDLSPGMLWLAHADEPVVSFVISFPKGVKPGTYVYDNETIGKANSWTINGTVGEHMVGIGDGFHVEATVKRHGGAFDVSFTGKLMNADKHLIAVEGAFEVAK